MLTTATSRESGKRCQTFRLQHRSGNQGRCGGTPVLIPRPVCALLVGTAVVYHLHGPINPLVISISTVQVIEFVTTKLAANCRLLDKVHKARRRDSQYRSSF